MFNLNWLYLWIVIYQNLAHHILDLSSAHLIFYRRASLNTSLINAVGVKIKNAKKSACKARFPFLDLVRNCKWSVSIWWIHRSWHSTVDIGRFGHWSKQFKCNSPILHGRTWALCTLFCILNFDPNCVHRVRDQWCMLIETRLNTNQIHDMIN